MYQAAGQPTGVQKVNANPLIHQYSMVVPQKSVQNSQVFIQSGTGTVNQQIGNLASSGTSKRQDVLLSRRKEKLKYDLVNNFGPQNIKRIEQIIDSYGDQKLLDNAVSNAAASYYDIYNSLSQILQNQILAANGASSLGQQYNAGVYGTPNGSGLNYETQTNLINASTIAAKHSYRGGNLINQQQQQSNNYISNQNKSFIDQPQQRDQSLFLPSIQRTYSQERQVNEGLYQPSNQSQASARRHLPVNAREKVFNEWGAVLKHQDELNEQKRKDDQMKERLRQLKYKQELDQQMAAHSHKISSHKIENLVIDNQLLEYQKQVEKQKNLTDNQRREQLKTLIKEKVQQSLNEKSKAEQEHREKIRQEQEFSRDQILKMQEEERQNQMQQKMEKQMVQNQYSNELMIQENVRKQKFNQVREDDKVFAEMEKNLVMKNEQNRQQYFEKLHYYQEQTDKKHQHFSNYIGDQSQQLALKDEQNFIKAVQQKEEIAIKKQEDEARKQIKTKSVNRQSLNHQVQEREIQKKMREIEDQQYAQEVKNYVLTQQQQEQLKQEEFKNKQREYMSELNRQIEETHVKKKYGGLMTEHERRVNDRDIKAYEEGDTKAVNTRQIPGIKSHDQDLQEKYIEKVFSSQNQITGLQSGNVLNIGVGPANGIYINNGQSPHQVQYNQPFTGNNYSPSKSNEYGYGQINASTLAMRAPGQVNRSQLSIGGQQQIYNINKSIDQQTLDVVKKNMEQPEAMRYRNNTGNRMYGFDQVINKMGTKQVSHNPEDINNGQYNYKVPANWNQ